MWQKPCLIIVYCSTFYSLSIFSSAKSLQLIFEISVTYRLVSYLLTDNWLIFRLHAQCMISNNSTSVNSGSLRRNAWFPITVLIRVPCDGVFVVIFFKTTYNETIIRFAGFCDIINNQGLGKCYQPRPSGQLITLPLTLIIPDITKTSSNNCLLFACFAADLFISLFFNFLLLGSALPWYLDAIFLHVGPRTVSYIIFALH